jgi:hypothetical protein
VENVVSISLTDKSVSRWRNPELEARKLSVRRGSKSCPSLTVSFCGDFQRKANKNAD